MARLSALLITAPSDGAPERISMVVAIGVSEEGYRAVLACVAGFRDRRKAGGDCCAGCRSGGSPEYAC
ncbi:MAG: hypothetical protein H0X65_12905 [Gemmatimonadetes bacterium]|nr:hypothetical protein [Gemmatimonadota bacterium]